MGIWERLDGRLRLLESYPELLDLRVTFGEIINKFKTVESTTKVYYKSPFFLLIRQ